MHTNHRRGFVASTPTDPALFGGGTKQLDSGKGITIGTGGCETYHNSAQHKKHQVKKALRQAERRDAALVIAASMDSSES
jgi:hypothetical protein